MEVVKADILGYCFGVRRAVEKAEKALAENNGCDVYSLGPLIHNKFTLTRLQNIGLKIAEQIQDIPRGAVVVIRAHGVPPSVINQLKDKNCTIVNATCPRVTASQKIAAKNSCEDCEIIFSGDAEHGEVQGIAGYAGDNFHLVQSAGDIEALEGAKSEKTVLFSQTTFSEKEFEKIRLALMQKRENLEVLNTICPATQERQNALIELCKKVDGVLVVGGKQSANTIRLYQTAKLNCKMAAHIESSEEIPDDFYRLERVGITAGASTPDELICEVCDKIK